MNISKSIADLELYKAKISREFFKIVKDDDAENSYKIIQYFGPLKGKKAMSDEHWFSGSVFLKNITVDSPVLDLNDYVSENGATIRLKTDKEKMLERLQVYRRWAAQSKDLSKAIAEHKKILKSIGLEQLCLSAQTFSELTGAAFSKISSMANSNMSLLSLLHQEVCISSSILLAVDRLHIEGARDMFEKDFKFFYAMIA